jgi:ferredoxin/flavodoxin---NADP+ reductase
LAAITTQRVTAVNHWNDTLFSFKTTRDAGLKFENGHFVMIGMHVEGKPLMRAYSIASPNYEEELEFFSIKVPDGPLTSRLQNIQVGDELLVSSKPTGTLVVDHLLPGRNLYLVSTGTGLAPFMSIIQDPEVSELAYEEFITSTLPNNEFFGEEVREKLIYYPTVTREEFRTRGRLTDAMSSGKLFDEIGLPMPTLDDDRFMICGSPSMLKDTCAIIEAWGFKESRHGIQAHYVIERAFVE